MSALTTTLKLYFTMCVLLFTATRISTCPQNEDCVHISNEAHPRSRADSFSSEETDDSEKIYSALPKNKFKPFKPLKPIDYKEKNQYASTANVWIIVVGVVASTVFLILFCFCLYYLTYGRSSFKGRFLRRQQPQINIAGAVPLTAVVTPTPSAPPVADFEENQNRSSDINQRSNGPPEYTVLPHDEPGANPAQIPERRTDTPPPAYSTL